MAPLSPRKDSQNLAPLVYVAGLGIVLGFLVLFLELAASPDVSSTDAGPGSVVDTPRPRMPAVPEPSLDDTIADTSARMRTGLVVDALDGRPIAGAAISGLGNVTSDAQGTFTITEPRQSTTLRAQAVGYDPLDVTVGPGADPIRLRLARRTLLRIAIVHPNGTAAAGARVEVMPPSPPRVHAANERGLVLLDGIEAGAYRIAARSADGSAAASSEAAVAERQHTVVTLTLAPAAGVAGVVYEADGTPAGGATLWAEALDGTQLGGGVAAADGTFRIMGLAPSEKAQVHAVKDARDGESSVIALARGQVRTGVVIQLGHPVDAIAGMVVDEDGVPLMGATVELAPSGHGGETAWSSVVSDGDGKFSFNDVSSGKYDVTAKQGELEAIADDIAPGTKSLFLQLFASATVSGRAVDENGAPVTRYHVKVELARDLRGGREAGITRRLGKSADVNAVDGRFSLGPFRPGVYEVEVTTSEGGLGRGKGTLQGKGGVDVGDIKLTTSGTITGRVVDKKDGHAIAGAQVTRWSFGSEHATTGVDGRFTITVPGGNNNLSINHPGYFQRFVRAHLDLRAGSASVDVGEIALMPGTRREIEGRNGFGGVGAVLKQDGANVVIDRLMDDGAGGRAGLKAGDVIVGVEGADTKGKHLQDAISGIRGESGSTVWMKVKRGDEVIDVPVRREPVNTGGK